MISGSILSIIPFLGKKPIPGRYDVPKLGLNDVTLSEIITAIYRRFVLGAGTVEYPTTDEREWPIKVVAEEPTDLNFHSVGNDTEVTGSDG